MRKRSSNYAAAKDRARLSVGDIILMSLELNDMTQTELAERSRIQPSNLSEIIHGKRKIGREVASRLAKVLNVPPGHLLFGGDEPRKGYDLSELYPVNFLDRIRKRNELLDETLKELNKQKDLDRLARKTLIHMVKEAKNLDPLVEIKKTRRKK